MYRECLRKGKTSFGLKFIRSRARVCMALAILALTPAMAQAQLVPQISKLDSKCGGTLNNYQACTAGEISISSVAAVTFVGNPTSCVAGEQLTIASATVNYEINTNTRNDLLIWIGNEEGTDPREDYTGDTESCSVFSIPGPFTTPPTIGSPFGDVDADQCGDIGGSPAAGSRVFTNILTTCQDNNLPKDGFADLQVLLTWDQNASGVCGTGPGQIFPSAGAVSKCDYSILGVTLPIVNPPILTLVKQVNNNSGGTAQPSAWALTATGPEVITGATGSPAVTDQTVTAGVYTLSETGPAGYTGTWNCTGGGTFNPPNQITLANGSPAQVVTCTVTNEDNPATLTLAKIINGGSAVLADWTLTATGSAATVTGLANSAAVVSQSVPAGNYTLAESGPTGYTASAWSCPGGTLNGNILTLALGQTVTCTITNTAQPTNLTLTKIVTNDNGGTAVAGNWTLKADDITFTSGVQQQVAAGVYTLSESNGPAGYTAAANWVCSGGSFTAPDQLTLTSGQTASCSITNTDDPVGLTLLKDVTNDFGGNDPAASFELNIAGGSFGAGQNFTSGGQPSPVVANVEYTLSEAPNAGYTLTNIECLDDSDDSILASGTTVDLTLSLGQSATCTYFNQDVEPGLTLIKNVINDNGGTAAPGDFDLILVGNDTVHNDPGLQYSDGDFPTVLSNVVYTLSEVTLAGYTNEGVVCKDDNTTLSVSHPVTLAEGQFVTCTITNNDQETGSFIVVKEVNNVNGGTAVAADFVLRVTGKAPDAPNGGLAADCGHDGTVEYRSGDSISPPPVDGCTYTVSEEPLPGYTETGIACLVDNVEAPHPVVFVRGSVVVCTITNDDDGAMLSMSKTVILDNGGTASPSQWTLSANGPTPQQGSGGFSSVKVTAADYTLSESGGPNGYAASEFTCSGGTLNGAVLTLANGDDVSCSITNNDIAPQLTLTKIVNTPNGGEAEPADWTLIANAINFTSGQTQDVPAAVYTLSESGPDGYSAAASWECTGNGSFTAPDQLTLEPGDVASCSITNTDIAPTLTLIKEVDNGDGGVAIPESFTLTLQGTDGVHDTAQEYSSGDTPAVEANVLYTVDEIGDVPGYVNDGVACVDTGNGNAPVNHPVTLAIGQSVTCTLTNNDVAPTLGLTKIVINDDSGEAVAGDFTIVLTGADGTHDSGVDYSSGESPVIQANVSYTLSEVPLDGYQLVSIECEDSDTQGPIGNPFTATLGQDIACTVTNDDVLSNISYFRVTKDFTDDNPGEVDVFIDCNTGLILDQTKTITESDGVIFVVTDFDPAELNCSIFENPIPAGYSNEYAAGLDDSNGNPGVGLYGTDAEGCHFEEVEGGDFYCTIVNELEPTEVEVNKLWLGEFEANGLSRFAKADYTCNNVRTSPTGTSTSVSGELSFQGDSTDEIIDIYPHWNGNSYCTIDETDVESAVEPDDSDCDKIPVVIGTVGSCTIYNTLFLEGIPTLNQYGIALLALLMLGMGMVGFRRFS